MKDYFVNSVENVSNFEKIATPGIYEIVNTITSRIYVGRSINVLRRIGRHVLDLNNQNHSNEALRNDWQTLGPDSFYVRVRKVGLPFTEDADLNALESAILEEYKKRGQKTYFSGFAGTRYIIEIDGKRYESAR